MKYIKACPNCGKMLRFPIDRGIIKISCKCGSSLIIDPDNTELYKKGKFDLSVDKKEKKKSRASLKSGINKKFSYSRMINSLLEFKYKLQNLSLMPDKERNKFLLIGLLIFVILIFLLYVIIN